MSKVKFEGLIDIPTSRTYSYKKSLLIPIECSMGPRISIVNSKDELYSKFTPMDSITCKSLEKYIDLGYELVIYRTNYKNIHSSIRLNETGYSYFDSNKEYQITNGELTSNSELNGTLTCYLNLDSIVESLFESRDVSYELRFYVNNFSYLIHISETPVSYTEFDAVKELKFLDQGELNLPKLKDSIIRSIREFVGLNVTDDLVHSQHQFKFSSDIPNLLIESDINLSYDIIHSNALSLDGLSLISRNPVSDARIELNISIVEDEVTFRISSKFLGMSLFEESIIGSSDPNSNNFILDKLSESKLIKYVDGTWNPNYVGTYELGYLVDTPIELKDIRFDIDTDYVNNIAFIVDPRNFSTKSELWDELNLDPEWRRPYDPTNEDLINDEFIGNQYVELISKFEVIYSEYIKNCIGYVRRLTNLATKLDSVVMIGYLPITNEQFNTFTNLIEVVPKIIDAEYNYSFELLLSNLSSNRLSGDVEFSGRLSNEVPINSGTSEILRAQYKYLITESTIKFMSIKSSKYVELSLSNYMTWYVSIGFMNKVIKNEYLGKMSEVDVDQLTSTTLKEFSGFIKDLDIVKSRQDRRLILDVTMELETQTNSSLILTGYLIGD